MNWKKENKIIYNTRKSAVNFYYHKQIFCCEDVIRGRCALLISYHLYLFEWQCLMCGRTGEIIFLELSSIQYSSFSTYMQCIHVHFNLRATQKTKCILCHLKLNKQAYKLQWVTFYVGKYVLSVHVSDDATILLLTATVNYLIVSDDSYAVNNSNIMTLMPMLKFIILFEI